MRFSTITIAAFAALAQAQSLSDLPKCAQTCVGTSLGSTGCSSLQIDCICKSSKWISDLSCCVAGTCSTADQQNTITFAQQLCQTVGVTLPTSAQAACAAGNGTSANTTASASSSTSSTAASGTANANSGASREYAGSGVAIAAAGLFAAFL
ncbi:hypothetical protein BT63DRAFT_427768 [Microthyrium microscopicum]|uniref:CFEM domain-containing protein n=1 Tax=Microthyrium microscopicum TaxID=703497 RepID=A0A6A6U3Y0_9PEZI|nr:hypothetical protein BT63DRAFT_427768 [Microthyrium microscopicum]